MAKKRPEEPDVKLESSIVLNVRGESPVFSVSWGKQRTNTKITMLRARGKIISKIQIIKTNNKTNNFKGLSQFCSVVFGKVRLYRK